MAQKQVHRTKAEDRVRIKDSVTHMYPMARTYMEGTVKATKHDDLGYPAIYIAWDKDHWAYSGEQDGWTLEAHFDLVEDEDMADRNDDLIHALADLVKAYQGNEGKDKTKPERPKRSGEKDYEEVLSDAVDDAADGDAFIILVARRDEFNGNELVVPHVYMHSKAEDAALMLEAAMADVGAQCHARLVLEAIKLLKADGASS